LWADSRLSRAIRTAQGRRAGASHPTHCHRHHARSRTSFSLSRRDRRNGFHRGDQGPETMALGGNTGIGKAIALELARQGANVAIDYISHPDATDELEKQVAALGDRAIGVEADVSKVADLERLVSSNV